jgi:hypothetical protein
MPENKQSALLVVVDGDSRDIAYIQNISCKSAF